MAVTDAAEARRAQAARRLPRLRAADPREAARVPRLGRHLAEAAAGARRDARLLRDLVLERAPRRLRRSSERATEGYEGAREKVRAFVNAASTREVIFTRNATEALNLVAYAWGLDNLGPGDVALVTELEHHSNFVPWQQIAQRTGADFRMIPIDDHGELRMDQLDEARRRRAGQGRRREPRLELARDDQPDREARRLGARARRDHGRRRRAGSAAPADRRPDARRRLRRLLVAQDVRPDRRRRALGPRASCSRRCRRSTSAAR